MKTAYKKDAEASKQLDDPQVKANIKNRMRVERTIDKLAEINKPNAKKSTKKTTKAPAKKSTKKSEKQLDTRKIRSLKLRIFYALRLRLC